MFSFNQTDPYNSMGYAIFKVEYVFYMSFLSTTWEDNFFVIIVYPNKISEGRVVANKSNHLLQSPKHATYVGNPHFFICKTIYCVLQS